MSQLSSLSSVGLVVAVSVASICMATTNGGSDRVEKWGVFEASFAGPADGNPFVEVQFSATFQVARSKPIDVIGFYDGAGTYRVRFMPEQMGDWHFITHSNKPQLDGKTGSFTSVAPSASNHGPVRVHNTSHFAYADSTIYREIGTTCYAWVHQPEALEQQTLATLGSSPFNKLRMCVFPKWYVYNHVDPILWPFEGTPPAHWDFSRPNPRFFQHLEQRIAQLRDLGIEADVILFHPYDAGHWGFDNMGAENDDRYVRYVIARLGASRNVWWSMTNEWDFDKSKTVADWERLGQIVQKSDPFGHLCSIHNGAKLFDHSLPWITHVSLQNEHPDEAQRYREQFNKPVIYDECKYEGNIPQDWGDITAQRLVGCFWKTLIGGAYCGHGETYLDPQDILWWSKGGTLHGQAPARLMFMKKILDSAPAEAGEPLKTRFCWGVEGVYYLFYFWDHQPARHAFTLPAGSIFKGDIIDTWDMTITPIPGELSGHCDFDLPTKPYQAIRLVAIVKK